MKFRFLLVASCALLFTLAAVPVCAQDEGLPAKGLPGPSQGHLPSIAKPTPSSVIPAVNPNVADEVEPAPGLRVSPAEMRRLKLLGRQYLPTGGKEIHVDSTPTPLAPNKSANFSALGQNGWSPYDAAIAVGPNHIVVMTNEQWIVYDRAGAVVRAVTTFGTWWGSPAGSPFDPKCFYDPVGGRFVMIAVSKLASTGKAFYHISVSQTGDPTGSWYNYQLDSTLNGTTATSNWADFPGLGYDDNAIYITSNQYSFSNVFQYAKIRVLSKAQLYSGSAATFTDFTGFTNSDGSLVFTPQPARTLSSTTSEYFLNTNPYGGNSATLWRISGAPANPSLVRQKTFTIGAFSDPPDAAQPGTTTLVVTNDARMYDFVWRNGIIHAAFGESFNGLAAVRYLRLNTTNNTVVKDATYTQPGVHYYYPAVTDDSAGNLYIVFTRSSATEYPSIYHTGMQPADSAIQSSALIKAGMGTNTSGRWGDYNAIANDPADSLAVVSYAGWANTLNRWATWITGASFASSPPTPTLVSVNPSSGTQGTNVNVTLTGQNTHWVQGTSVINISGTGVTASGVTVSSATSLTATLSITASAATGSRNVTVTTGAEVTTSSPFTVNLSALIPTLTSVTPSSGWQGTSVNVTLAGTNFVSGATIGFSGTGITAASVVVVNSSTITATFSIASSALLGAQNVTVTTSSGTSGTVPFTVILPLDITNTSLPNGQVGLAYSASLGATGGTPPYTWGITVGALPAGLVLNPSTGAISGTPLLTGTFNFTAQATDASTRTATQALSITISNPPAPTLSLVSPLQGNQGQSVNMTLTGTELIAGLTTIAVGGTGVTPTNLNVTSSTQASVTLVIASNAALGNHGVTLTTPGGTSNSKNFVVYGVPFISMLSPAKGAPGSSLTVTFTGSNFMGGQASVSGSGITLSNRVVNGTWTQLSYTFTIGSGAALGPRSVTISTPAGTSNAVTFNVGSAAAPPTLASVNPNNGNLGQTVNATLTGSNFLTGATVNVSGAGVTAGNVVVVNTTTITANLLIGAAAATGARNITVTTSGGTSGSFSFTVNSIPTITTSSLPNGEVGLGYNSTLAATSGTLPYTWSITSGVLPSGLSLNSSTGDISGTASLAGTFNFTAQVTDAFGQTAPKALSIAINNPPAPTLNPLSPGRGQQGTVVNVSFSGTNFVPGFTTLTTNAPGLTITNLNIASSTAGSATFNISASTPVNDMWTVNVITPGGTSNTRYFAVYGVPTLTSISPTSGTRGTSLTVTFNGTNFLFAQPVFSCKGITTSNRVNTIPYTQFTITFNIASTATVGPCSVRVSNFAGTSSAVTFSVK